MVLDGVVGSAAQQLGDVRPPAALRPVVQVQQPLLVLAPLRLVDTRVQMVVPPYYKIKLGNFAAKSFYRSLHCLPILPFKNCAMFTS